MQSTGGNRLAGGWLQTKLKVGSPNDPAEREADRVADSVTSMPSSAPIVNPGSRFGNESPLRRTEAPGKTQEEGAQQDVACDECEDNPEEEELRRAPADSCSDDQLLNSNGPAASLVHQALHSGGQPLDPATRSFMEPRLGYDFGQVTVHTDEGAAQSARAVNALAYTVGSHVVFGANHFAPQTDAGRHLLAHELAHVAQNTGASGETTVRRRNIEPDAARIEDLLSYSIFDWVITDSEAIEALNILARLPVELQKDVLRRINLGRLRDNLPAAYLPQLDAILKKTGPTPVDVHKIVDRIQDLLSYGLFDWAITDRDATDAFQLLTSLPPDEQKRVVLVINYDRLMDNLPDPTSRKALEKLRKSAEADADVITQNEQKKQKAIQQHEAQQRNVAKIVDEGRKLKVDPAKGIWDQDNVYRNSIEMLDDGKVLLSIMTPTHYSVPDVEEFKDTDIAYFDYRVKFPKIGGDYPADPAKDETGLTRRRAGLEGDAFPIARPDVRGLISIYTGTSLLSAPEFKQTFVHEVQHIADLHEQMWPKDASNWEKSLQQYKTEFRSFWVEPDNAPPPPPPSSDPYAIRLAEPTFYHFGSRLIDPFPSPNLPAANDTPVEVSHPEHCTSCPPAPAAAPASAKSPGGKGKKTADPWAGVKTRFTNKRQERIFWYLISNYKDRQFDCLYICNPEFRKEVDRFSRPEGINLINSVRLPDFYEALRNTKPAMVPTDGAMAYLVSSLKKLDELDWTFLRDTKDSAPLWATINASTPPYFQQAMKNLIKISGKPSADDINRVLEAQQSKTSRPGQPSSPR